MASIPKLQVPQSGEELRISLRLAKINVELKLLELGLEKCDPVKIEELNSLLDHICAQYANGDPFEEIEEAIISYLRIVEEVRIGMDNFT